MVIVVILLPSQTVGRSDETALQRVRLSQAFSLCCSLTLFFDSVLSSGQCCQQCVDPHATCIYEGHEVPSQHRWLVDKCTTCQCFAGKITCATQRCR